MLVSLTRALTSSVVVVVAGKSLSASRRIRSPGCDDDDVARREKRVRIVRDARPRDHIFANLTVYILFSKSSLKTF